MLDKKQTRYDLILIQVPCIFNSDYGLGGLRSNHGGDGFFRPPRPSLGPTQPPVQWVAFLSRGGKVWSGLAADHSPPSSAAVMEEWSYTSIHPLGHTRPVMGNFYLFLYRAALIICYYSQQMHN